MKKKLFALKVRIPKKQIEDTLFPLYAIDLTVFGKRFHTKERVPRWLCKQNFKLEDGRCYGYSYGEDGDPLDSCTKCAQYVYKDEEKGYR